MRLISKYTVHKKDEKTCGMHKTERLNITKRNQTNKVIIPAISVRSIPIICKNSHLYTSTLHFGIR